MNYCGRCRPQNPILSLLDLLLNLKLLVYLISKFMVFLHFRNLNFYGIVLCDRRQCKKTELNSSIKSNKTSTSDVARMTDTHVKSERL